MFDVKILLVESSIVLVCRMEFYFGGVYCVYIFFFRNWTFEVGFYYINSFIIDEFEINSFLDYVDNIV